MKEPMHAQQCVFKFLANIQEKGNNGKLAKHRLVFLRPKEKLKSLMELLKEQSIQ